MGLLSKLKQTENKLHLNKLRKKAKQILNLDKEMQSLSDESLQRKTNEFQERYNNGESLDDLLVESFAVVREAADRILKMKHYEVQLIGGMVLHEGNIAEMSTGEGKTLAATLPAYLNALSGNSVHIVTVNEYLAERDHALMSPLFRFLGLETGYIVGEMDKETKRDAYKKDIVYLTNTEVGFDYLRDNMVMKKEDRVQNGLSFCIVDEVDSVLLDDARTPLIISGEGDKPSSWYSLADMFARSLQKDKDFTIDEEYRSVMLTEDGYNKAEKMFRIDNIANTEHGDIRYFIEKALSAHYVMKRDKDYIIQQNEIKIIDQSTGRVSEGRRFSNGLHQALEAKEGVRIKKENQTLASITYQNFFLLYDKLAGMTGTAKTSEEEFNDIYKLKVITIPTNKPIIRKDLEDKLYFTKEMKHKAIIQDIKMCNDKGQPVLVGTSSIDSSEELSNLLTEKGIAHNVLNAKNHKKEAMIIQNAGQKGAVTIATNMAGRGTDIKLGEGVRELGGLKVIGTERASNRRIDNQLLGRSGRQGDPGESQFYLSFDDDLLRIFASGGVKKHIQSLSKDDENPIEITMLIRSIHSAQARIDGSQYDARKQTIEYDAINSKQREIVYNQRNQLLDESFNIVEELSAMAEKYLLTNIKNTIQEINNLVEDKKDMETMIKTLNDLLQIIGMGSIPLKDGVNDKQQRVIEEYVKTTIKNRRNKLEDNIPVVDELRSQFLLTVDMVWRKQLERLEEIKEQVKFAGFKQENPLDEYASESHKAFEEAMSTIQETMIREFLQVTST